MSSVFITILVGHIGGDATMKKLPSGTSCVNFNIATEPRKGQTLWNRVSVFGTQAENLLPYLRKGTLVQVTGTPTTPRGWVDPTGAVRAAFDINANNVQLLSAQNRDEMGATAQAPAGEPAVSDEDIAVPDLS